MRRSHLSLQTPLHRSVTTDYEEDWRTTTWAIWLAWPLPLAADCLVKCQICKRLDRARHSGSHSLESDVPLGDGLHLRTYSLFSCLGPVNAAHSASGVCAGGVWANVKWTIRKRSEQVIFLCCVPPSLNVRLVNPLHISSDLSCGSHEPYFSDTSSLLYAALHTEASFCWNLEEGDHIIERLHVWSWDEHVLMFPPRCSAFQGRGSSTAVEYHV